MKSAIPDGNFRVFGVTQSTLARIVEKDTVVSIHRRNEILVGTYFVPCQVRLTAVWFGCEGFGCG